MANDTARDGDTGAEVVDARANARARAVPDGPPLRRETVVMVDDRARFGVLMALASLGGVGVGFALAALVFMGMRARAGVGVSYRVLEVPDLQSFRLDMGGLAAQPRLAFEHHHRGMLGVAFAERGAPETGVVVTRVMVGSPAERAGVRVGDIIARLGERPVADGDGLRRAVELARVGDPVPLVVRRDGGEVGLSVAIE
jgi:membrane-associated protease RseP (regulator of RpoE activity)